MKKVHRIKTICILAVFIMAIISHLSWSETGLEGRKKVVFRGKIAAVSVDVAGGSIIDFHLNEQGLNPLTWNYPEKGDLKPRTMGHFICFDRWGQPSPRERENGMPFHGEAAYVEWQVLMQPVKKGDKISAEMLCELPMGGMRLKRTMNLYENAPVLLVREEITNVNKLGRVYNIVQHPSIAPPFLDESLVVDCNAHKGFMQSSIVPGEPVIYWPKIVFRGELVDLCRLMDNHDPNVVSFVFEDGLEYGWVTACNPGKGLMIGYIWKLSEYPWLNIWRNVQDGRPVARGLEFGTTSLHKPFADLLAINSLFDRPLYEYCDAGQTIVKSYVAFLSRIPVDYNGVQDIRYRDGEIIIKEKDAAVEREIIIKY